ncbi:MAG: hypothetical protein DUD34_06900 [Lactobacillus sp.]|jgi:hypothetical protein|nr:MAG: hypothetical protein DUD34_06900 [Lactobacillus sp.]
MTLSRAGQKALSFQSVAELSEYSEPEYLDNSATRPEVAFCPAFLLGNNRVDTNRDRLKRLLFQPLFAFAWFFKAALLV